MANVENCPAGDAEHALDTLFDETIYNNLGTFHA
jgi:hypothetical protein